MPYIFEQDFYKDNYIKRIDPLYIEQKFKGIQGQIKNDERNFENRFT